MDNYEYLELSNRDLRVSNLDNYLLLLYTYFVETKENHIVYVIKIYRL